MKKKTIIPTLLLSLFALSFSDAEALADKSAHAAGFANGAIGGTTYDGSDTGGNNGFIIFDVEFTIDASSVGSSVDGEFGIQVDIFSWTHGDLVPTNTPHVTGPSIVGNSMIG